MFHFDFSLPFRDPVLIFSIVLLIILLSPIVSAKLKIPSLVGLLLAGMIFGPHGFNILRRDSSIILFGTVGLLYIMFMAALEIDINQLWKNKYRSLLFGSLTFTFPFIVGFVACRYALHFSLPASILIASMFSTHTLVAYPVVSHFGLLKNSIVPVTIGGTVITDTLVLLILAVITGSHYEGLNNGYWIRLGVSASLFCCIVFGLFPLLTRWFFRNLEGEKISHFIFVLSLVFLAAFFAKVAGMEPIIGAFAAGLTLNRLIPKSSPLMNRIEFTGNALFIPFFLIGVGMLVDLKVLLLGYETLVVACVLTFGAIGGKWLAAFVTQKICGYTAAERNLIFGLSSSHAAATLAVILIGFNLGIVGEIVLNATIILILVSCLVGTIVTERVGKIMVLAEKERSCEPSEIPQKTLIAVANPSATQALLDFALMIQNHQPNQPIAFLTVVQDDGEAIQRVTENKTAFDKIIKHASAADIQVEMITRIDPNPVDGIARVAKELAATDIIMGWTGQSKVIAKIFGTKLDALLHNTQQTVFVCRLTEPVHIAKRIVALVPSHAEFEHGFTHWLRLIERLCVKSGTKIIFACSSRTQKAIKAMLGKKYQGMETAYRNCSALDDLQQLTPEVLREDLILLVSARETGISYDSCLDSLPSKLAGLFPKQNLVILYPAQDHS